MAFTWFDKFGDVLLKMPPDEGKELAYAIAMYGSTGELPEVDNDTVELLFIAFKDDIDNSKDARERGSKGGRPKKPEVSETQKPEVSETQKPEVSENTKPNTNQTNTNQAIPTHASALDGGAEKSTPLQNSLLCLQAYNEVFGTTCTNMPTKNAVFLNGLPPLDADEVKGMVRFKQDEWQGTSFNNMLTPRGLFSPDNFESYMQQSITAKTVPKRKLKQFGKEEKVIPDDLLNKYA